MLVQGKEITEGGQCPALCFLIVETGKAPVETFCPYIVRGKLLQVLGGSLPTKLPFIHNQFTFLY
jgi:hypothetical protein